MRSDLPTGTVTFLFTDVEGSTKLLHELGSEAYADALSEHRRVVREACRSQGGVEVDTQGDAFFFGFPTAPGALSAAETLTGELASGPIRVRVGLHTGTPLLTEEGYVGDDVHRAARIAAAGHGGQVLVSSSTASLVERELTDLGEHRLKDLSAPERTYQLGNGSFPVLKSLYRTNLPVPATPFLGREAELAEVVELLTHDGLRLLTLTGPGGTGKTRLALQAVAEASDRYPDGVWWVPLAPLRDPALMLKTAAQAVSSPNGLAEHISDKQMLCLFDNFEQVVEAGAELADLLASCPNLDVVVTSRERLRVQGEQSYPVPPLAEKDGAVLFSARARAVDPAFTTSEAVAELCVRLDLLPLALELAAARTALFSPEQLLERLSQRLDLLKGDRDADPRQQTLRATIEWSYDLLSRREQDLFARLSVFAGGCSYEAAEQVAGADPDTLQSLLDKSLLRKRESAVGPRYWMLETLREYAAEEVEDSGETKELQRRHADWFVALAEEAEPHLTGSPKEWLERLRPEQGNFRVALDRIEAVDDTQLALRLAGALVPFWYLDGGHSREALDRLERVLAADESPTAARARALTGAGGFAAEACAYVSAARWQDEALALHRTLGDRWGAAYSIFLLGYLASTQRDWANARTRFEDSLEVFRELGDEHFTLLATQQLAWMCEELGDMDRGRTLREDVLELARAAGNQRMEAMALQGLAFHAWEEDRFEDALSLIAAGYRIHTDLGERDMIAGAISRLARVHAAAGRPLTAAQLLASSEAYDELGESSIPWIRDLNAETLAMIRAQLDQASLEQAWQEGGAMTPDEAIALGLGESDADV